MKLIILWSDIFIIAYSVTMLFCIYKICKDPNDKAKWSVTFSKPSKLISLVIILLYLLVALLDSIHFQNKLSGNFDNEVDYSMHTLSILDILVDKRAKTAEASYSQPFALELFAADLKKIDNTYQWVHKKLEHVYPQEMSVSAFFIASLSSAIFAFVIWAISKSILDKFKINSIFVKKLLLTFIMVLTIILIILKLAESYHVLGTDKVGKDVLYISLKSIRTGLIIGLLPTFIMVPIAVFLGITAGYFRGVVDDIVQYIYTTISSIPGVLLIAASVLSLQLWLEVNQSSFSGHADRVEMRLVMICLVLGLTSWPGLCRLIRAEVLKIRTLGYIEAAKALNIPHIKIITRHILPNVMYLVIIASVMDISGLVLAESVLSYVGVGVDPSSYSWGNMINGARMELSRTPVVWWTLFGAFLFMFVFVVAINEVADAIRDIYEPRTTY